MHYATVHSQEFRTVLNQVIISDERIATNVDLYTEEQYDNYDCYLALDRKSGFAIHKDTHELVNVFSTVKGRGHELVQTAVGFGANNLNCFDGYLAELYRKSGFEVVRRATNWTAGEPDVVYMERTSRPKEQRLEEYEGGLCTTMAHMGEHCLEITQHWHPDHQALQQHIPITRREALRLAVFILQSVEVDESIATSKERLLRAFGNYLELPSATKWDALEEAMLTYQEEYYFNAE